MKCNQQCLTFYRVDGGATFRVSLTDSHFQPGRRSQLLPVPPKRRPMMHLPFDFKVKSNGLQSNPVEKWPAVSLLHGFYAAFCIVIQPMYMDFECIRTVGVSIAIESYLQY